MPTAVRFMFKKLVMEGPIVTLCPGPMAYDEALAKQVELHAQRLQDQIPDTLLLLQHRPVITVGLSGGWQFLKVSREDLEKQGIDLRDTDRGGKITYHNPGQVVGYPIVKISDHHWSVSDFVCHLQKMLIRVLADFGIVAETREKIIGVWTKGKKIASVGIRLHQGVTRHGFALNVNNDLSGFQWMDPCGLAGCEMTSMQEEGVEVSTAEVEARIIHHWEDLFESALESVNQNEIQEDTSCERVAEG
ncbi:MAG: lipoyl(octanoyl) transferase LipB [Deltaproteobacteria bacterium]|nr:lipoyl(octanoyl) transferase LipB [Deltaproteobacteria bacterium]